MTPIWSTLILVALWSWGCVVVIASLDRLHEKLAALDSRLDEVQQHLDELDKWTASL
jgi:hypothetical protein